MTTQAELVREMEGLAAMADPETDPIPLRDWEADLIGGQCAEDQALGKGYGKKDCPLDTAELWRLGWARGVSKGWGTS